MSPVSLADQKRQYLRDKKLHAKLEQEFRPTHYFMKTGDAVEFLYRVNTIYYIRDKKNTKTFLKIGKTYFNDNFKKW